MMAKKIWALSFIFVLLINIDPSSSDDVLAEVINEASTSQVETSTIELTSVGLTTEEVTTIEPTTVGPTTEEVTTIGPPDAPENVMLTSRTTTSLSFSWEYSNSQPFNCNVTVEDETTVTITKNCTANTVTITDLPVAGKEYIVLVYALDENGQKSDHAEGTARTKPPAPSSVSVATSEVDSVTLDVDFNSTECEIDKLLVKYGDQWKNETDATCDEQSFDVTVKGLTAGKNYRFEVYSAIDDVISDPTEGDGSTKPEMPQIKNVTASENSLTIRWDYTAGSNENITGQMVECTSVKGVDITQSLDDTVRSHTCQPLTPGSNYNITVTAKLGDLVNVTETNKATHVAAPENIAITSIDETSIEVTWDDENGDLSHFAVHCHCENAEECRSYRNDSIPPSDRKHKCTGLTPGNTYIVTITASRTDDNKTSTEQTAVTSVAVVTDIRVDDITSTSISVSWTHAPGGKDNYLLMCGEKTFDVKSSSNSSTCTDLTPGTSYTISVETILGNDTAEAFYETPIFTTAAAPESFDLTSISETSINIMWGEIEGQCDNVEITYQERNDDDATSLKEDCKSKEYMLTSLKGNGHYNITIKTLNPAGGLNSTVWTQAEWTYPGTPENLAAAVVGPKSINISWIYPSNNANNDLKAYVLYVYDKHDGSVDSNCVQQVIFGEYDEDEKCNESNTLEYAANIHYEVENLEPCTDKYEFFVQAVNEKDLLNNDTTEEATTVGEPEGQVTIVDITPETNSVSLKWDLLLEPRRCDISYIVSYEYKNCSNDDKMYETEDEIKIDSLNITGLQPYWNYTFQVTAMTGAGSGNSGSEKLESRTLAAAAGPPRNLEVKDFSHESINITWDPPDLCEQNGPIDGYNVSWVFVDPEEPENSNKGGSGFKVENGNTYMYKLDAKPYKNYTITVKALSGDFVGETISYDNLQTNEWFAGIVSSETIDYSVIGSDFIDLRWSKPEEPQGKIVNYSVKFYSQDCKGPVYICNGELYTNSSEAELTIVNLQPDAVYNFSVRAYTKVGGGPYSDVTNFQLEIGVPLAPTIKDMITNKTEPTELLVEWSSPDYRTGPTNYSVLVEEVIRDGEDTSQSKTVEGFDTTSVSFGDLIPYWNYRVNVTAFTKAGSSPPDSDNVRMPESTPLAVGNMSVEKESGEDSWKCDRIAFKVTWDTLKGKNRRGIITGYNVKYNGFESTFDENKDDERQTAIITEKLAPSITYIFSITASTSVGEGDVKEVSEVDSDTCPPKLPDGETEGDASETKTVKEPDTPSSEGINRRRQFELEVYASFFSDDSNGDILDRGFIIHETPESSTLSSMIMKKDEFNQIYDVNWNDYNTDSTVKSYRMKYEQESRYKRSMYNDDLVHVLVGEDKNDCKVDEFCNGYVKADKKYKVQPYVCTDSGCTLTSGSVEFATVPESNAGAIAGGVIGGLLAVGLLVLLVLFLVRRDVLPGGPKHTHTPDPIGPLGPIPEEPPKEVSKPIRIENFIEHVTKLHRDSGFLFAEEYQQIKEIVQTWSQPHETAELPPNRIKNRYTNILAFDEHRVKLLPTDNDPSSDYINANYMVGYNSKREFIASQGPLPSTLDDFWRMIWEQNCPMIVMVTKLKERDRIKCEKYWPDICNEPVYYGDLQVSMRSESVIGDYTIRLLDIKLGETGRTIKQFHYTAWPDFGCPDTTDQLLNFVKVVREHIRPDFKGPIVAHCSAGVGRTGTFIAVDRILQHIKDHDSVDIYGIVLEMRRYRCHMVQTEDQYVYIHDCIRDAIKKGLHRAHNEPEEEEQLYANQGYVEEEEEEQEALYENVQTVQQRVQAQKNKNLSAGASSNTSDRDPVQPAMSEPLPSPFIDLDWLVYSEGEPDTDDEAALVDPHHNHGGVVNQALEMQEFGASGNWRR